MLNNIGGYCNNNKEKKTRSRRGLPFSFLSIALLLFSSSNSFTSLFCEGTMWDIANPLAGQWIQVYNNKFVQETSEIDWGCVHVSIELNHSINQLHIKKEAILHNNEQLTATKETTYLIYTNYGNLVMRSITLLSITNPILILQKTGPIVFPDQNWEREERERTNTTSPTAIIQNQTGSSSASPSQYEYAILTGTDDLTLFVFCRTLESFHKYQYEISDFLIDLHFVNYYNSPVSCFDFDSCTLYEQMNK